MMRPRRFPRWAAIVLAVAAFLLLIRQSTSQQVEGIGSRVVAPVQAGLSALQAETGRFVDTLRRVRALAEEIKIAAGHAYRHDNSTGVIVRGRHLLTGLPDEVEITGREITEAIRGSVEAIVEAVTDTIEETPPELVADLMARGITLAGGGALLPGLADLIAERTGMNVFLAEDPLGCVVRGTGKVLAELDELRKHRELEVLRKVLVDVGNHGRRPRR